MKLLWIFADVSGRQKLLQGDRRGQSQSVLRQVSDRHAAIAKIEQQMIELAELFQDMDAIVVQQEAAVVNIEQQGEQVTQDVGKANEEIAGAIVKARSRNRKKWWCLGISSESGILPCMSLLTRAGSPHHPRHHHRRRRRRRGHQSIQQHRQQSDGRLLAHHRSRLSHAVPRPRTRRSLTSDPYRGDYHGRGACGKPERVPRRLVRSFLDEKIDSIHSKSCNYSGS